MNIDDIKAKAIANQSKAFSILGHSPGPGDDIRIFPTNPISSSWLVEGLTPCGKAFLFLFYPDGQISDHRRLGFLKRELEDWGIRFKQDWSMVIDERAD